MNHYFKDVQGLGNVAVSRHAQARCDGERITEAQFLKALNGTRTSDGQGVTWCEADGVRLIVLNNPTPNHGAKLVKTVFRVQPQARVR